MNLYGLVKNARKLLLVACVCLSDHLFFFFWGGGGVVWVILKNIYPAKRFKGEEIKILARKYVAKKFRKIKQRLGAG